MPNGKPDTTPTDPKPSRPRRPKPKTRTTKPIASTACPSCHTRLGRPHKADCKHAKRCTVDRKHFGACVRWAGHLGGHAFDKRPGDTTPDQLVTK